MTKRWFAVSSGDSLYLHGIDEIWFAEQDSWAHFDFVETANKVLNYGRIMRGDGVILEQPEMPTVAEVKEALGL